MGCFLKASKDGVRAIIDRIYNTKGIAGFFKGNLSCFFWIHSKIYEGLTPKLIQSVINSAIMLVLYEKLFTVNRVIFLLLVKKLTK